MLADRSLSRTHAHAGEELAQFRQSPKLSHPVQLCFLRAFQAVTLRLQLFQEQLVVSSVDESTGNYLFIRMWLLEITPFTVLTVLLSWISLQTSPLECRLLFAGIPPGFTSRAGCWSPGMRGKQGATASGHAQVCRGLLQSRSSPSMAR